MIAVMVMMNVEAMANALIIFREKNSPVNVDRFTMASAVKNVNIFEYDMFGI